MKKAAVPLWAEPIDVLKVEANGLPICRAKPGPET